MGATPSKCKIHMDCILRKTTETIDIEYIYSYLFSVRAFWLICAHENANCFVKDIILFYKELGIPMPGFYKKQEALVSFQLLGF